MSQEEIRKVENDLNEQLNKMYALIAEEENFNRFFDLASKVANRIRKTLRDYEEELYKPKEAMKQFTFLEIIDMVDKFYKKYDIDINVHELVKNGTIFTESESYEQGEPIEKIKGNSCQILDGSSGIQEIKVNRSGTLYEAFALVHELSHYRDKVLFENGEYNYSLNRDYLTESLADTEGLIFLNSLDEIYNFDKKETIRERLHYYNDVAMHSFILIDLLIIFRDYHYISEETYKHMYDDEEYGLFIGYFKDKKIKELLYYLKYLLCPVISIRGLELQKENESFITKAQELHELILESPLANILTYYSLPVDEEDLLSAIDENLKSLCEETFSQEKNKQK